MRVCMFVVCACAALSVSIASAHGPQIQVTVDSGKITTRQILPGNTYSTTNGLTATASIYVMPVNSLLFNGSPVSRVQPLSTQVFGPGFTYGYDQFANPRGTRLFSANLELHLEGLQIWNGASFVDTGVGMEQLGLIQSSGNVNPDTLKTIMGGDVHLAIPVTATYGADEHSSVRYQLLGDGLSPNVASRDGIYLVTMEFSGLQAPSLTPSDTFYYILGKNVSYNELSNVASSFAASQSIGSNLIQYAPSLVPEPGTMVALVMATFGMLSFPGCSRRKRG